MAGYLTSVLAEAAKQQDEQAMLSGTPVLWFKAMAPDAADTAALIINARTMRSR